MKTYKFQIVMHFSAILLISTLSVFKVSKAFDITLDTDQHTNRWKFQGSYVYGNSLQDIQNLTPKILTSIPLKSDSASKNGIWMTKHVQDGKNEWNVSTSLTHLLFSQGWVTYLADPSVPLVIKSSRDGKIIGSFWSDGKSWCDAVFKINLISLFLAEITTPKNGDYAMIDKIVLGVMSNITSLKRHTRLNPCLTSPPISETDLPDMEEKSAETNEFRRRTPDQGPPDMEIKKQQTTTKLTPTDTSMRTYQTETGGAKCDCVCSCKKPNNMTYPTPTMSPPI